MGTFDEYMKNRGFLPLELNEDNVNTIYKRCLPTEDTNPNGIVKHWLFLEKNGFDTDKGAFYFDEAKLKNEYKNIIYLLGQLYDVHASKNGFLSLKNFSLNRLKLC